MKLASQAQYTPRGAEAAGPAVAAGVEIKGRVCGTLSKRVLEESRRIYGFSCLECLF